MKDSEKHWAKEFELIKDTLTKRLQKLDPTLVAELTLRRQGPGGVGKIPDFEDHWKDHGTFVDGWGKIRTSDELIERWRVAPVDVELLPIAPAEAEPVITIAKDQLDQGHLGRK
jgi:hypothetical protein